MPRLQNDCSIRRTTTLPEIINGFEALLDFLSVKQLAIANPWFHADRLAFSFLRWQVRFEVATTSSTLYRSLVCYRVYPNTTLDYKLRQLVYDMYIWATKHIL